MTPYRILFLCTGNSARSIMAECIMNRMGAGRFEAFSAGSHPKGAAHPETLRLLEGLGYDVGSLRSKSWDEFAAPGAPPLDFVITVCDDAAGEICPIWPGRPTQAHWGIADPARAEGSPAEIALAFADAYRMLGNRISLFTSLPIEKLDRIAIKSQMDGIGRTQDEAARA